MSDSDGDDLDDVAGLVAKAILVARVTTHIFNVAYLLSSVNGDDLEATIAALQDGFPGGDPGNITASLQLCLSARAFRAITYDAVRELMEGR